MNEDPHTIAMPPDLFALASVIDETIILDEECGTTLAPIFLRALNHRGWFLATAEEIHS